MENNTSLGSVTSTKEEIDNILSTIARLQAEHHVLIRHVNSLRSATRKLPQEVLSIIFLLASPPVDITSRNRLLYFKEKNPDPPDTYGPLHLGAVCSQWFHAAQSTPQLWSSLVLDVPSPKRVAAKVSLLQTYLENVKLVPFSLEINLNRKGLPLNAVRRQADVSGLMQYDFAGVALLAPFYKIIFKTPENSRRIRVLRMSEVPAGWRLIPFKNFSILEELDFGNDGDTTLSIKKMRNIDEIHTPHLNRIILKNTWFSPQPRAAPLTVVNLFRVPVMHCFEILRDFPNLMEFRAREIPHCSRTLGMNSDLGLSKFTMPQLEIFEWTESNNLWSNALLTYAQLPALRVLAWGVNRLAWGENMLVDAFFRRLPQSLGEFEIVRQTDYSLRWSPLGHVRKLSLCQVSLGDTSRVLGYLETVYYLPALQEICLIHPPPSSIDDCDGSITSSSVRQKLRAMIERRSRVPGVKKIKLTTVKRPLGWKMEDRKWIEALFERGFVLEVYEDERLKYPCKTRKQWRA